MQGDREAEAPRRRHRAPRRAVRAAVGEQGEGQREGATWRRSGGTVPRTFTRALGRGVAVAGPRSARWPSARRCRGTAPAPSTRARSGRRWRPSPRPGGRGPTDGAALQARAAAPARSQRRRPASARMETMRGGTSGRRGAAGLLAVAAVTAATALAGSLAGDFESTWYRRLQKPSWQPSGRTIGLVWTGLYTLTAASALLLLRAPGPGPRRRLGGLFGLQYLLNAAFTPLFTRRRDLALATLDSALLCGTLAGMAGLRWRVRRLAAVLLLPSVAWTAFATFLSWR